MIIYYKPSIISPIDFWTNFFEALRLTLWIQPRIMAVAKMLPRPADDPALIFVSS